MSLNPYRRRISAGDARGKLISAAAAVMSENDLPVTLATPSFEAVIQQAGVSRSTAYRLFPDRQQFEKTVLQTLISDDPYRSEELHRVGGLVVREGLLGKADRAGVIARLGWACITVPDHLKIIRIEAAVGSLAATSGADEDLEAGLDGVRTSHLQTVGELAETMHATWGETVSAEAGGTPYEVAFASMARVFALEPLGAIDVTTQSTVFGTIADRYIEK